MSAALWAVAAAALFLSFPSAAAAAADGAGRTGENAVAAAEDAFGTTVGREQIGLYDSGSVRGFSPTTAGNVRIEGLYFDEQSGLTDRINSGSTIKVGVMAQTDPFPAPTGIVDLHLRPIGRERALSVLTSVGPYGGAGVELDAAIPVTGTLSLAAGVAAFRERFSDGGDGTATDIGLITRWTPNDQVRVTAFWGRSDDFDETAEPVYLPRDDRLPPRIARGIYAGPSWARDRDFGDNAGLIAQTAFGAWTVEAGLFRSLSQASRDFANLIEDIAEDGSAQRSVFADPPSRFRSYSGELRVSRTVEDGPRRHLLLASLRGRDVASRFGGSDFIDLGRARLDEPVDSPEPVFRFGDQTRDRVTQSGIGLSYGLTWSDAFEVRAGLQHTDYSKEVEEPGAAPETQRTREWLPGVTASVGVAPRLRAYGSYTRGLEENGVAPDQAANRLEILPALITEQLDAGLRWRPHPDATLVIGYFDIRKPYIALGPDNVFGEIGNEIHSGLEMSLSAELSRSLRIVGGAVISDPRVEADGTAPGEIGRRPVAQPRVRAQLNIDYRAPFIEGLSVDASINYTGRQAANLANTYFAPGYGTVDLGMRYAFRVGGTPATFRAVVSNIANRFAWIPDGADAFEPLDRRAFNAYLALDF